jgi:hypothetical protein
LRAEKQETDFRRNERLVGKKIIRPAQMGHLLAIIIHMLPEAN